MKKMLIFIVIASIILLSSCSNKNCANICSKIPEKAPKIIQGELEQGWYYGQLNQKKIGTPNNWIHYNEGSESASWFEPNENNQDNYDCNKWTNPIFHAKLFFNNIRIGKRPSELYQEN